MLRVLAEGFLLFLTPFLFYALFMAAKRRYPHEVANWERGTVAWLAIAGLALCIAGVLALAASRDEKIGAYSRAEFKDGKLIPGSIK